MRSDPHRSPSVLIHRIHRRGLLLATGFAGVAFTGKAAGQDAPMVEEPWSVGGLAGTFAQPRGAPARSPVALLIAGSGPTPRDGGFGTLNQIAGALAASEIRSYRFDKRGVGGSRELVTREDDLVLGSFVNDAIKIVQALDGRADVSSVVMVGHSEGALIATLAAATQPVAGVALLAGPGRNLAVVLREQLQAIPLPPDREQLRTASLEILEKLTRGERVASVPPEQAALFRPSVQPFLLSVFEVDPAVALARLPIPALVMWGANDIQVTRADFDALKVARSDIKAIELPLTNHIFKLAPPDLSDRAAQIKSYDPAAPVAPGVVPALVDFIRAVAR
jgi:pimeloyl-ACP methyl ester carboxylesterase